jgi:hypothetical protein
MSAESCVFSPDQVERLLREHVSVYGEVESVELVYSPDSDHLCVAVVTQRVEAGGVGHHFGALWIVYTHMLGETRLKLLADTRPDLVVAGDSEDTKVFTVGSMAEVVVEDDLLLVIDVETRDFEGALAISRDELDVIDLVDPDRIAEEIAEREEFGD